ncbi:MAG: hypothetical protein JO044_04300 [Mycobacteriaceae bacterium]|nr:hypothetical protein [Mycobacteriaceae bacterium]
MLVALIAAGVASAVTYAVTRGSGGGHQAGGSQPSASVYSAQQVADAKAAVCQAADTSARGRTGLGGIRDANGHLNIELALRSLNSVVAVEHALSSSPATPPDVADAARAYIDATLKLTSGGAGDLPTDQLTAINDTANNSIFHLIDVCGLPR